MTTLHRSLLTLSLLGGLCLSARAQDKPNIVVIWGDDIGVHNISKYNHGIMGYQTPNIDRIANEGAFFTDAYAQQSCTAGRAAFILGQHPFRTGLLTIGMPGSDHGIPDFTPTIADLLKTMQQERDTLASMAEDYDERVVGCEENNEALYTIALELIDKYEIALTERQRADRKKRGLANMQYIRYGRWFLLLVTAGHHRFKQDERKQLRDCRRHPIRFEGYSISYRRSGITPAGGAEPKWHACVRIDPPTYRQLKAFFQERAVHRSADTLAADFARIPFARYAPIRRQLLTIHKAVNTRRSQQGYEPVPVSALRLRRQTVRPFAATADNSDENRVDSCRPAGPQTKPDAPSESPSERPE